MGFKVLGCRNKNTVRGCFGSSDSWLAGEAQGGAQGTGTLVYWTKFVLGAPKCPPFTTRLRVCNKEYYDYHNFVGEFAHASPYRKEGLQGAGALMIDKGVEQHWQVSAAHFLLDVYEGRREARKLRLVDNLNSQCTAICLFFL